jgi:hypothetical protein
MEQVIWNGLTLPLLGRYSNFVIIRNPATGSKETIPISNIQFVGEEPKEVMIKPDDPGVTVQIGSGVGNALSSFKRTSRTTEEEEEEKSVSELGEVVEIEAININELSLDKSATAARKIPGIGKVTLNKFIENRPDTGYEDLSHLRSINASHCPNLRWSVIEPYLRFA